ncbi:50S ribosomal protein L21e [Candidatus Pacearchaeota archaeon]|nr:50S ribosomal protein L21e [Candidatus Pacearchaeota archaeon]
MSKGKKPHEKGKLKLSRMFQELKKGNKVGINRELAVPGSFPKRIEGRTGIVEGKRGRFYIIKINDFNQEKKFIIDPIHLKKIEK